MAKTRPALRPLMIAREIPGFEFVGEIRHPKPGEYFIHPGSNEITLQSGGSWGCAVPGMPIYRKLEDPPVATGARS